MKPIKTERWARDNGFTHHGRLHGVPVWLANSDDEPMAPHVQAKNWLFDLLLDAGEAVFELGVRLGLLQPVYAIAVGKEIERPPDERSGR